MQVLLNIDPHVDGRHSMAAHLETVVKEALGRFGEQVTRVEAHLVEHAAKAAGDTVHCTLEARLAGLAPVAVKEHAATPHQALNAAVAKLQRAVGNALGRHDAHMNAVAVPEV
jgi:ribosome-associated translation inhibitor RaiA